ncbi:MAG: TraB/GumN family protein [Ginsengibacter sp.]
MKGRLFFLFFISLIVTGCKAQQNNQLFKIGGSNNSLLWQISGNGLLKPSFVFGTFHLLCKDDIKFSDQLKSAIQYTDGIYMELDMDDLSTLMSGFLYMNMKNGKVLKDFYTPAEYKRIEQYFNDSLHMPFLMLQKAKPYFLMALLYPKMMKCKTFSGVEDEVMKLAKEYKKEIMGLETMEFQSSIFDSIPYEIQAKELIENIDSLPKYASQFDTMLLAYKNQELSTLENSLNESEFGMEKYKDLLLDGRNINWAKQLHAIMKKKSVFVAVGAGHLAGEKGLLSLLKKEGYKVEPLQNK